MVERRTSGTLCKDSGALSRVMLHKPTPPDLLSLEGTAVLATVPSGTLPPAQWTALNLNCSPRHVLYPELPLTYPR